MTRFPSVRPGVMLAVLGIVLGLALPRAALADTAADAARIARALDLPGVLDVMRAEGADYGAEIDDGILGGRGGAGWAATLRDIYDLPRLEAVMMAPFTAALEGHDRAAMLRFFDGAVGHRAVVLEISARRALLDPAVEAATKEALRAAETREDPRLARIDAFIDAGDLIEANVAGGLNSSLAFLRGLRDGGLGDRGMSEDEMLAQVWAQEPDMRAETVDWLRSYLLMAYQPLSDAALEDYIAFSRSPAGQALNRALFAGFDEMFADVSYRLGLAAARRLSGEDL